MKRSYRFEWHNPRVVAVLECSGLRHGGQTYAVKKLSYVVVKLAMSYTFAPHWARPISIVSKWLASVRESRHHDVNLREISMYAVIKTGGKQYRVEEGDVLRIEKLEVGVGETLEFDEVLLVANGENINIGQPLVEGAKVTAEVVAQGRHKKIRIVKLRRRKHSRKQQGHRQWFTEVKITGIAG